MNTDDKTESQEPTTGSGFLPAPVPADIDDAPVAVVASGMVADDDPDILEPTQIMPPVPAHPGAYGQLGPAPGPQNPDQPWGPGTPAGGFSIPTPPPYGQPGPGAPYPGSEGTPPYDFGDAVPAPRDPGRRRLLVIGGVVVALVVVGAGSFFGVRALTGGTSHAPPVSQPTHGSPPASPPASSPPPDGGIDSVVTDGKPMTVAEVFPTSSVSVGGTTFGRVRADVLDKCANAANGGFEKVLRQAGCERVVAATFVDKAKKYAVTTGIAALSTKDSATNASRGADSRHGRWFAALPGKKGSGAEKIAKSGGFAASLVWGRYIVFSYATYSNGKTPPAKDARLTRLSQDFRTSTAHAITKRASS
ncbi:MAG TPA: hypothetical protein VGL93_00370 [Streptosporangiaceae bacterium]|jgi:hypothetical protein